MRRTVICGLLLAALALPGQALARGGDYAFDGGTPAQQAQVRAALDASAFDWSVVPTRVTIHLRRGIPSQATPGHVWLDADLLAAGRFGWAVVQDEYAHQVDFFLFDGFTRARLLGLLGGRDWFAGAGPLAHHEAGAERFASTLVWSYWPSRDNAYRPTSASSESAAMEPARFRKLMNELVGAPLHLRAANARR